MPRMIIKGEAVEIPEGTTVESAAASAGLRPNAYIFLIGGKPVPMDSEVPSGAEIVAMRVASGGRSGAGDLFQQPEIES
jgi:sulfur carrier protein